jgi:hypothetical protein
MVVLQFLLDNLLPTSLAAASSAKGIALLSGARVAPCFIF